MYTVDVPLQQANRIARARGCLPTRAALAFLAEDLPLVVFHLIDQYTKVACGRIQRHRDRVYFTFTVSGSFASTRLLLRRLQTGAPRDLGAPVRLERGGGLVVNVREGGAAQQRAALGVAAEVHDEHPRRPHGV